MPTLAVLSLFVPVLFVVNILFVIYWIARLKRQFLLSAIILLLGFPYVDDMYKFSGKKIISNNDIKIMSYNVRMFNLYLWNKRDSIPDKMYKLINDAQPDILALQEFHNHSEVGFQYPYKYTKTKSNTNRFGLTIQSKYPIINSGSFDFENSANNIIYADLIIQQDTVRVYNIHLESLKLNAQEENFGEKNSDKLLRRLKTGFKKQVLQVEQFLEHQKNWDGKTIVCGDFNNTPFSWAYTKISKGKKDAFIEAGKGFGKTFDYTFPVRIDFIFTDPSFEINYYKTFNESYSDHFPILTHIKKE